MSELALTLPRMRRLKRPPARIVMLLLDILGGCLSVLDGVLLIARRDIVEAVLGSFLGVGGSLIVVAGSIVLVVVYIPQWLDDVPLRPVTREEWREGIVYVLFSAALMANLLPG